MKYEDLDIAKDVLIVGVIGSIAGLASMLRSNVPITLRAVLAVVLNTLCFSVAVSTMLIYQLNYKVLDSKTFWLLCSVSVLSGLGGTSLIDFVLSLMKAWAQRKFEEKR